MENQFLLFLQEIVNRLKAKSPKFFVVWQWIFAIALAITGIPSFLDMIHIPVHTVFEPYINKAVAIASGLLWVMSKMPVANQTITVTSDQAVLQKTDSKALPFTKQEQIKQAETKGLVGNVPLNDVINATVKVNS